MAVDRRQSVTKRLSSLRKSLSLKPHNTHTQNHAIGSAHAPAENKTIFQGFEWFTHGTATASHWKRLTTALPQLKAIGIDTVWLPPGCKASSPKGNGYDIYDLYDLGEFDQKGSRATKWGNKDELVELCQTAKSLGVGVIWDAVLNHKAAADGRERSLAVKVSEKDRRKEISSPREIDSWTSFTFPGRGLRYSSKHYHSHDFSGVDYDAATHTSAIYKFVGAHKPGWAPDVDTELGNYDYLMFNDLDYSQPEVRHDVHNWGSWITNELGLSGFRLDAMKHYSQSFQREFVQHMDSQFGRDFFFVGEYWKWDSLALSSIIGKFKGRISLFDVQLVYNLSDISAEKEGRLVGDLRRVFEGALVQLHPQRAVTFVQNHDTQPTQSLPAPVESWFLPHAYALILLRAEGTPSVFYGDLYGTNAPEPYSQKPAFGGRLARMMVARKRWAWGKQKDYFDEVDCIGWTRSGHKDVGSPSRNGNGNGHSPTQSSSRSDNDGLAVLLNSSWTYKSKKMFVGKTCAGEIWTDILGWSWDKVEIDEFGEGVFNVGPRSVGVWVREGAKGRKEVDGLVYNAIEGGEEETGKGIGKLGRKLSISVGSNGS